MDKSSSSWAFKQMEVWFSKPTEDDTFVILAIVRILQRPEQRNGRMDSTTNQAKYYL